jgi:hypothetical protein
LEIKLGLFALIAAGKTFRCSTPQNTAGISSARHATACVSNTGRRDPATIVWSSEKQGGNDMKRIRNFSENVTDAEIEPLTATLLFYLVERCGGEVLFTPTDAIKTESGLSANMLQMQVGENIRLRIITRPPELQ